MKTGSLFRKPILVLLLALGAILPLFAEGGMTESMTVLVIQLGLIIIAAYFGGRLMSRLGMPSVLGELGAGILLSQGLLGGIALPGFPQGLFPADISGFAVSTELYGFATLASIILLFMSGLETDIGLFKRYAAAGLAVGLGGVIFSFGLGSLCGVLAFHWSWMDPRTLFLGILGTATSVGITARILSDQRKMDSPEGVTILAAAVIDDVLGIVCLAVVLGIASVLSSGSGTVEWGRIGGIAAKAIGIWGAFTLLGLLLSKRLARFLKTFRTPEAFAILALGLALLLAGFFETEGLAMIIGAYIMGLSLSGTDLKLVIREKLQPLYMFLVPVFFAVMGMLVDLRELASPAVLAFGGIYTLVAFGSKIVGCALPSLLFGFNGLGAMRIGVGMIPRGEVALIIAGIGISGGFLDKQLFGVVIMMTLLTTVIPPPLLKLLLRSPKLGTKSLPAGSETVSFEIPVGDASVTELLVESMTKQLRAEGFFVHLADLDSEIHVGAREDSRISIRPQGQVIVIETRKKDLLLAKALAHETFVQLDAAFKRANEGMDPDKLVDGLFTDGHSQSEDAAALNADLVEPSCVSLQLQARTKEEAIRELVGLLEIAGKLEDSALVSEDVLAREKIGSTGLERGIAFPHGRSEGVKQPAVALGLSRRGIDFGAADGKPAQVIAVLVSPKDNEGPHLRVMAALASALSREGALAALLDSTSKAEAAAVFSGKGTVGETRSFTLPSRG